MAFNDTTQKSVQTFLLLLGIGVGAFGFRTVWADGVSVHQLKASQTFHIRPQPLSSALLELSQAAKLKIFYDARLTRGINSPGLSGSYSPEEALRKLLEKTGISYSITASGSIKLQAGRAEKLPEPSSKPILAPKPLPNPAQASDGSPPPTLATMKVVSKFEYESDDPYNPNYVLPKATAGTKTDTPIMATPLNVQVVSKQVLKDQQVISLDQALKNVSGVTVIPNTTGGNVRMQYQSPVIRGFASQTFFRNGFRLQEGSASRQFANVESIEVLKGPAAILYGQVEPGGMVNVVTKKPQVMPYYALNQQFGSFDLYRTSVDATGPVGNHEELLYRVNFSYQNSNSFRDFVYTDDVFIAPVLQWKISPKTQITLEMEYDRNNNGIDNGYVPIYKGNILDKPLNTNWGELSPARQETFFGNVTWSHSFNDAWSIKHQFSVNQVAGRQDYLYPYGPAITPSRLWLDKKQKVTIRPFRTVADYNTYSTNLDLTGHFGTFGLKHTLLFGGDYYRLDNSGEFGEGKDFFGAKFLNPVHHNFSPLVFKPFAITSHQQGTDQYGLYLQDQIEMPYRVYLLGGFRYQYLHQESGDPTHAINKTALIDDALTPRVGLLWQPQDWLSLYGNYVESFGANGIAYTYPNNDMVPATSARQYEIGAKTEFFGGRLRATLAYYELTKTNLISPDPLHKVGCIGGPCSLVIGEARSQGPELDIQGEILPGWQAIATFANTDVQLVKGDPNWAPTTLGSNHFADIPTNTASFWSTYTFQSPPLSGFSIGAGVNYSDSFIACCADKPFKVDGYKTVGLMAGYSRDVGDAKVSVQLNINNLLDERYFTGLVIQRHSADEFRMENAVASYGAPRSFMGSISIQY